MIDWEKFLTEHDIDNWPYGGLPRTKQCRGGWINLQCCHCGSSGSLLGLHEKSSAVNCYFCGSHSIQETVKELIELNSWSQAYQVANKYKTSAKYELEEIKKYRVVKKRNKSLVLPPHTNLKRNGAEYLKKRGFSPTQLINDYGIKQGAVGSIIENRILIPIYFDGDLVSWIARDITGKSKNKYWKCKDIDEVVAHKEILYGYDWCDNDFVFVCEGTLDVLKFPKGTAVATLGVRFSDAQMNLLKKFKKVYICYDTERQAVQQAKLLANGLSMNDVDAQVLELNGDGDIGDLSYGEIEEIVEYLAV